MTTSHQEVGRRGEMGGILFPFLLRSLRASIYPGPLIVFTIAPRVCRLEEIPQDLVLYAAVSCRIVQEPDSPLSGPGIERGPLLAKGIAQLITTHEARWLGELHSAEQTPV